MEWDRRENSNMIIITANYRLCAILVLLCKVYEESLVDLWSLSPLQIHQEVLWLIAEGNQLIIIL